MKDPFSQFELAFFILISYNSQIENKYVNAKEMNNLQFLHDWLLWEAHRKQD